MEDAYDSKQIHKNWIKVLTTSTIMKQDIETLRKKVGILREEYEASKGQTDDVMVSRRQYSMALSNLSNNSQQRSECRQIIRLQWELYDEADPDTGEKEEILWEIAKTINNNVKTADSLEECKKYSKKIQEIMSSDDIRSDEIKEKILLEYAKSLVNRFLKISSDKKDERSVCIQELKSLYFNSKQRESGLTDQFLARWILGLNNAAATCKNEDEATRYLVKREELLKL